MNKVILDDELRAKLNGMTEMVEVCEPSGATVGHFVPHQSFLKLLAAWDEKEISTAELRRRADRPGGKSLAEIMKRLVSGQTSATGI